MEFKSVIERVREIRKKYAKFELQQYGREWTGEELALGYMKDVGDLARLIQAKEGIRSANNVDEELGHELSDCIWSAIVLADKYGVDIETEFMKTMDELDKRLG